MCRVTRHHTRKHRISTGELEAKPGTHDIRCHDEALCSFEPEGAEILLSGSSVDTRTAAPPSPPQPSHYRVMSPRCSDRWLSAISLLRPGGGGSDRSDAKAF